MGEMTTTRKLIGLVRRRMAFVAALEDLQHGAAWGAAAGAAAFVCVRLRLVDADPWWAAAVGGAATLAPPIVRFFARRSDDLAVAAAADERLDLRERLSTSLWWEKTKPAESASFGPLVVADAEAAAARVAPAAVAKAFRPRLVRRPLLVAAGLAALACGATLFAGRAAQAVVETSSEKAARLADANRLAEVARKIEAAAKRVEEAAAANSESDLAKVAAQVKKGVEPLTRAPSPPREEALKQLNALADVAREQARRSSGRLDAADPQEMRKSDAAMEEMLKELANAGLPSLRKELAELEDRLAKGEKGEGAPSAEEVRRLANRIDALRKAMSGDGGGEMSRRLRSLGNEALLAKIGERLRKIASRLDKGQSYEDLQSDAAEQEKDLAQMSEEELKKLLDDLDQLAGMKDLEDLLRQGNGELRGGRKMRLSGSQGT